MIRGDLPFELPFMKTKLDFQASLMDFNTNQLTFTNLNNDLGVMSFDANLIYEIKSVILDFSGTTIDPYVIAPAITGGAFERLLQRLLLFHVRRAGIFVSFA